MIKRFKIREGVTFEQLSNELTTGGSYIHKDVLISDRYLNIVPDIDLEIGSPEDLSMWNDQDYVLIIDFNALQPFEPFYKYRNNEIVLSSCLENLEKEYNAWMSSRWYLEEIK